MQTDVTAWSKNAVITRRARKVVIVAHDDVQAELLAAIFCRLSKTPMSRSQADMLKIIGDVPAALIDEEVVAP